MNLYNLDSKFDDYQKFKFKVKLICHLLSNSHVYSFMGCKLTNLYSLEDDIDNIDNLKLCVFKIFKNIIYRNDKYTDEKLNIIVDEYIKSIFIDNENTPKLLFDVFGKYDMDFSHPLIPVHIIKKLSPKVKNTISKILLSHTDIIQDIKPKINKLYQYDLISDSLFNLDELFEYSLFAAKYSQYSGIGYLAQMKYDNSEPLSVFDKQLEFEIFI